MMTAQSVRCANDGAALGEAPAEPHERVSLEVNVMKDERAERPVRKETVHLVKGKFGSISVSDG